MPTLVVIGALRICVYADDHHPPHFHAILPDHEALIDLRSFQVLRGVIRRRDLQTALEWAEENRHVLEQEWRRLNEGR